MLFHRRPPTTLVSILGAALLLLLAWSLVVPIFEAPDEPDHWKYARYIHETGGLPLYSRAFVEAVSPPLYYLLLSPLALPSDAPPPHSLTHPPLDRRPVWRPWYFVHRQGDLGRYWPIRVARLFTALLSLAAVGFAWLAGKQATGSETTGALAAALMAFLPQFSFRGMNVSNDALVVTSSVACTYLIVRLVRRGFSSRLGLAAAGALAVAILSKLNGLALLLPLGLALVSEAGPLSSRMRRLWVLGLTLLLIAPWLAWNRFAYGDVVGRAAMLREAGVLASAEPPGWEFFLGSFPRQLASSFVGQFGWMNVPMPGWAYLCFTALAAAAGAGLLRRAWSHAEDRRLLAVLAVVLLAALTLVVHFNRTIHAQAQGRYLFPALGAAAVLAAMGLEALPGWSPRMGAALAVALAALNAAVLAGSVRAAYWPAAGQEFSTRVKELPLSRAEGLVRDGDGFTLTGLRPRAALRLDQATRGHAFLELALSSTCPGKETRGSLFVGVQGKPRSRGRATGFEWRTDGSPHRVLVPLFARDEPQQPVSVLRIQPYAGWKTARRCRNARVELSGLRLTGGLDERGALR